MKSTWFSTLAVLVGLALFSTSALAQSQKQGEGQQQAQFRQLRLTDKQVQGYISFQKDLAPLSSKLEAAGNNPGPALKSQVEQTAKRNGFPTLQELDDVAANIELVLSGLDPQTGNFTEPPELITRDMVQLEQDKQMPKKEKDKVLLEMQKALKVAAPLQFKENVALVKKYQKELDQVLQQEPAKQQQPTKKQVR